METRPWENGEQALCACGRTTWANSERALCACAFFGWLYYVRVFGRLGWSSCEPTVSHCMQHLQMQPADVLPAAGPCRRGAIRERAQLLITNPDMLHMSVLPVHGQFRWGAGLAAGGAGLLAGRLHGLADACQPALGMAVGRTPS